MKIFLILVFMYNGLAYAQDSLIYRDPRVDSLIKKADSDQ